MTIVAAIKRHAMLIYFALVFVLSGGSILLIVGPEGFPLNAEEFASFGLLLYAAILAGPCVAGVLMTAIVDGRPGLRHFFARLRRWRVGWTWYAIALLPALQMQQRLCCYPLYLPISVRPFSTPTANPAPCWVPSDQPFWLAASRRSAGRVSQSLSCGRAIPYSRPG